jgi:hypothetical protein
VGRMEWNGMTAWNTHAVRPVDELKRSNKKGLTLLLWRETKGQLVSEHGDLGGGAFCLSWFRLPLRSSQSGRFAYRTEQSRLDDGCRTRAEHPRVGCKMADISKLE